MVHTRYLVIGGSGLVGAHMLRALQGRDVRSTRHRAEVQGSSAALDITDDAAVRETVGAIRPGVVVLAAAQPHVEHCERKPDETRRVNVGGTRSVADACAAVGATLVVFSSEYVFDGALGEYRETDAVAPLNEYGRQKVAIEEIARGDARHLICRTSGVFGREAARKNFVLQLVDALRDSRPFKVPSDQVITPSDAASLGECVVELLDRGSRGTFHVAGPERLPRVEFAQRAARAFGLDPALIQAVTTSELGSSATRPLRAGLRDDKLLETLGHGLARVSDALRVLAAEGV